MAQSVVTSDAEKRHHEKMHQGDKKKPQGELLSAPSSGFVFTFTSGVVICFKKYALLGKHDHQRGYGLVV